MVTRRNFVQAIAGAMLVPIVDLRAAVPRENLMLQFCDGDMSGRYRLNQPFGIGRWTYATDARSMIRAELVTRNEVGEMRLPPVENVWNEIWHPTRHWRVLDDAMMTTTIIKEWQMCPHCGGARVSYGESYPTDQSELYELVSKYSYDSDDNTTRDRSCNVCHGLEYTDAAFSDVLGLPHSTFGLKRIAALPNPMVCRSATREDAILFRADGFEGISLGWSDER